MRESQARSLVVRALRSLDAIPVENALSAGTPDISHVLGWIELKVWRSKTGLRHFRPAQRAWLTRRALAGGVVHVLIVDECNEWWLFDGLWAATNLRDTNKRDWIVMGIRLRTNKEMMENLAGFIIMQSKQQIQELAR